MAGKQGDQGRDTEDTVEGSTIPDSNEGVGATSTDEPNTFEPEEDEGPDDADR